MSAKTLQADVHVGIVLGQALASVIRFVCAPLAAYYQGIRDQKLILRGANPVKAYSDFSSYKESSIETRTVVDSRGRTLAQIKLWIYGDSRVVYREVTPLNALLRASVGLNRVPFAPLTMGKGDSPVAMLEVATRDFEAWLRHKTPGTQFGMEGARAATAQAVVAKVASLPAPVGDDLPQAKATAAPNAVQKVAAAALSPSAAPVPPAPAKTVASPAQKVVRPVPSGPAPKVQHAVRGRIVDFGVKKRTLQAREFDQYCVDLVLTQEPDRGLPHRVWGADLERVLAEAQARKGHEVEIYSHGSLKVQMADGGSSQKNCFSIMVFPS